MRHLPFLSRSSGGTLTFESAPFDRGRLTEAGVRYHVTDHLGSVRAVINGNASTTIYPLAGFYSVDDFAPFGIKSASSASSYLSLASTGSTVSLRDGFTGQEDQGPDFGVSYSDFGARQYSPSLSRWLVPDPLGEKYYDVSPYAYCVGNPVNYVDPEGKKVFIFGSASASIVEQLQQWAGEGIELQLNNETQELTYTLSSTKTVQTKRAKRIADIIDNASIAINMYSTSDQQHTDGGSFYGNAIQETEKDVLVTAFQLVNPSVLKKSRYIL